MRVKGQTIAAALVMALGVALLLIGYRGATRTPSVAGLVVTAAGVLWGLINLISDATGGEQRGR
jgi:hypothetical protein